MQIPRGTVVSVSPDGVEGTVVVAVDAGIACARCASGKGCGAGLIGGPAGMQQVTAIVPGGFEIATGDEVKLLLEPANVLRAALIVYGLPLSGGVIAAASAYMLGLGDLAAALAALAGLAGGIISARLRLKKARCLRDFIPVVTGRQAAMAD